MGRHSDEQLKVIAQRAGATKVKVCTERGLYRRAEDRRALLGEVQEFLGVLLDQVELGPKGGKDGAVVRFCGGDVAALHRCIGVLEESMRELEWDSEGVRRLAKAMAGRMGRVKQEAV